MMSMCLYCIALFIEQFSAVNWLNEQCNEGCNKNVQVKLAAFFAIRKEITEFLETAGKIEYDYFEKLQNEEWLCILAFLTDNTKHLNILNLNLQDKQNIGQLMSHTEAFRKKLRMFEEYLKSNLKFFKSCSEIRNELNAADF
ncbi:hypothetical protein PR048_024229 [Dryococelus australis]|uniref:Uncharacterized protein n=1 Tax=Dryococelus australis TaxID=614101 RepID=A0ABQ9GN30_9NEOP|nr:hypothetical protein PR048_024229 [Dryococelus australis]